MAENRDASALPGGRPTEGRIGHGEANSSPSEKLRSANPSQEKGDPGPASLKKEEIAQRE